MQALKGEANFCWGFWIWCQPVGPIGTSKPYRPRLKTQIEDRFAKENKRLGILSSFFRGPPSNRLQASWSPKLPASPLVVPVVCLNRTNLGLLVLWELSLRNHPMICNPGRASRYMCFRVSAWPFSAAFPEEKLVHRPYLALSGE